MIEPTSSDTLPPTDRLPSRARLALVGLVVLAALVDLVLWRRIVGRWLPPETPWPALAAALLVGLAQGAAWCVFAWDAARAAHPFAAWYGRHPTFAAGLAAVVVAGPAGLIGLALCPAAPEFAVGGLVAGVVLLGIAAAQITALPAADRRAHFPRVDERCPSPRDPRLPLAPSERPEEGSALDGTRGDDSVDSSCDCSRTPPFENRGSDDGIRLSQRDDGESDKDGASDDPAATNGDGLLHAFRRTRLPDGTHVFDGTCVAEFSAGARNVSLHLPIWPVLPGPPEATAEPVDAAGDDVRVTVGQARTYGIRFDVRRAGDVALPARVAIAVAVRARPAVPTAAPDE